MSPELSERLKAAAKASGRSLSQEIELWLERASTQDQAFGGADVREVVLTLAAAFAMRGQRKAREEGSSEHGLMTKNAFWPVPPALSTL